MAVRIIFTFLLFIVSEGLLGQCTPGSPDSDGDGICDSNDLAPNNPCTSDGIIDGIEPENWLGFADFKDFDKDGIPFTCDDCIDENENGICDGDDPDADLKIALSHKRGYYKDNFRLYIGTNDPNATIRYTLNNSKPTPSNGSVYNNSILITGTTLLSVFAYSGNKATKIYTHSFLFTDDIIESSVMNTFITQDAEYGPQMEDALKSLPVISLVSNLINEENIDIERETSVEMFWPDDSRGGFMIRSGIQTWGGSPTNPKKAFRLEFKDMYGDKKLEYDIFKPDNYDDTEYLIPPTDKFNKLLLRASSQDGLNGEVGNEKRAQFLRNRFLFDTQIEMGQVNVHGRYVHIFLNGEYRGQYHLMERPDESFFETYFGGDKTDYEIRKSGDYWGGSGNIYDNLANKVNLSTATNIENTKQYVDLESAAIYMLLMSFASGADWSENHNSLCGGNITSGNGGYKYLLWDVDLSLGNGGMWDPRNSGSTTYFNAPLEEQGPLVDGLINNTEFKFMMADQMECACYNDGLLTIDKVRERYAHRKKQIEKSLIAESARWGDYTFTEKGNINVSNWNVNDDFLTEYNRMINTYFPARLTELKKYFLDNNISSDMKAPSFSQYGGQVSGGYQLTLTNPNNDSKIYYTLDGTDPRTVGGEINSTALLYSGPITLPDGVVEVKTRVRNNSAINGSVDKWSGMCPRKFYVNQNYSNLVINEIHYNPSDSIFYNAAIGAMDTVSGKNFEFIELKNRNNQAVYLTDLAFTKGITLNIENDLMIPANGYLVFAENEEWFQRRYGFLPDATYAGKLSDDDEWLTLVDPSRIVIDSVYYNDRNPWDEAPDGDGYSLELLHPSINNEEPLYWFRSDNVWGTPKATNSRICSNPATPIVINEINYNSDNDNFDPGNWVELYNPNSFSVDLTGWTFYDNNGSFVLPAGTSLGSDQYLVLVEDEILFRSAFPLVNSSKIIGDLSYGFDKAGERLSLFDPNKCLSDYVIFNDKTPWPTDPDGNGPTLSLLDPFFDNGLPESWESSFEMNESFVHGSPGVSNICEPGQPCNDGDSCTTNDTFDVDCNCIGIEEPDDIDNDGICDLADICPNFDDNLIGKPCEDGDDCTTGELYDENCGCSGGVSIDIDDDGICDALDTCIDIDSDSICDEEDLCLGFDDNLLGQLCDDGNPLTDFDTYNANTCSCSGIIASAELCVRISTSSDDAEEKVIDGIVTLTSGDLDLVDDEGVVFMAGLRFQNIDIPQGATIKNATIQFTADEVNTTAATLIIKGEASDNAPTFTNNTNNISQRTTTTKAVTWMPEPWNSVGDRSEDQLSVNLTPVLQEIIDRPGFSNGNATAFLIEGTGIRTAESFDASAVLAPELCITYSTGVCVVGYPCDDGDESTINDAYDDNCDCVGQKNLVRAKIFLEGYYDAASDLMRTSLLNENLLPLNQPYNAMPWNYDGTESLTTFPSDAVDWVLVMARDVEGNILSQTVGLLSSTGNLMSLNGDIGVVVENSLNNYISIHHRSHLAIISANPYAGGLYDFTTAESQVAGIEQLKLIANHYMLHSGDYDASGIINNADFNDWKIQGAILNKYLPIDGDGNGIINSVDYNLWIINNAKIGEPVIRY